MVCTCALSEMIKWNVQLATCIYMINMMPVDVLLVQGDVAAVIMISPIGSRWILVFIRKGLTHWGRDLMAAISQTTFSSALSWMKMYEFRLRFHLTHCCPVDLQKWAILTPYWFHQSLGYLKKIWMPVVNIHWCPWTLKFLNIKLLMLIIKC